MSTKNDGFLLLMKRLMPFSAAHFATLDFSLQLNGDFLASRRTPSCHVTYNPFSREMYSGRPYARFYITARRYREPSSVIDNPPRRPHPLISSARPSAMAHNALSLLVFCLASQLTSHPAHHDNCPTAFSLHR